MSLSIYLCSECAERFRFLVSSTVTQGFFVCKMRAWQHDVRCPFICELYHFLVLFVMDSEQGIAGEAQCGSGRIEETECQIQ